MAETTRKALAEFLRSRRDRLTPEEAGVPRAGRRRAPGLRREEVASLAGVGLTWYTWLEQGRPINASVQVLLAVARALRLNPAEQEHLLGLAGFAAKSSLERGAPVIAEAHRRLLEQLLPYPAFVVDDSWDLFAYNRVYRHFWGDLAALPEGVNSYVSRFRAAMADRADDARWVELVARLRAQHVGAVVVDTTNLALHDNRKVRMAVLAPADESSAGAFARLDALFASEPATTVRSSALQRL